MTDWFAELGVPRRPVVDEAVLKERYFQLAAGAHPDAGGGDAEKFRAIREAYQGLLEPAARLRHLAELEFGKIEGGKPGAHADLFLKVGGVLQEAKAVLHKLEKAQSPLARALVGQDKVAVERKMREVVVSVDETWEGLLSELKAFDTRWPEVNPGELRGLAGSLTFISRWQRELAETEFRLTQEKVGG